MQFCRMYTGDDGKSHFEEYQQNEGAKLFQTALAVKALMFKNDQNRDDLHGWHNAPRRQWCITLSGSCEIGIGDGRKKPSVPAMFFSPKMSPARAIPRCRRTGCGRLSICNSMCGSVAHRKGDRPVAPTG